MLNPKRRDASRGGTRMGKDLSFMALLIDGYNLLNSTGILAPSGRAGSLERSRLALLNFLVEMLDPQEIPHTTVVFDAHEPPPGLPRVVGHRGLTVRFASRYPDADSLIEELIRADTAPRRLTVVSSDHRIQRAARRRRARAVDSHVWYAEIVKRRSLRQESSPVEPIQPALPLGEADVAYWLQQFSGERSEDASRDAEDATRDATNPFPPGYADDVER